VAEVTDAATTFAAKSHTHAAADLTDGATTFAAKAHTHTAADITNGATTFAAKTHSHVAADTTDFTTAVTAIITPLLNRAGTVANTVMVQSRDQSSFLAPNSGNGTAVTPLTLTITPKKAGNRMILEWIWNGECSNNTVWMVTRDGNPLTDSSNSSNTRWAGITAESYDSDNNSTPDNTYIRIIDFNTQSTSTTYELRVRSSDSSQPTCYLNRTVGSTGTDSYEAGLSSGVAWEIWQ
jgi:hypothetical protein